MLRDVSTVSAAAVYLAEALVDARRVVVLTGAGLSTESGIPDYRSPGGIWSSLEPILFDDFLTDESARLTDWQRRFDMAARFAGATPNAAHTVLAKLASRGPVELLVTQNIDGLHGRAGTPADKLIEIHGNGDHATCLSCGRRVEIADAERTMAETGAAPRCEDCGGLVKAAIVSFGQPMPEAEMVRATEASARCDLFLALGSSLVVFPAASLPIVAAEAGAPVIIASREPTELDGLAAATIRTQLGETFAAVGDLLRRG